MSNITKLENVIQPEIFNPYVINKTMELSEVVQSGIMLNTPEYDTLASAPNTLINMPFWEDITGEEETITEDGFFTPGGIQASKDMARKQMYGRALGANNLTALLAGSDPMAAIGNRFADYWTRILQGRLLAVLEGIFAAESMSGKILDISEITGSDGYLSGDSFIDATQLMGDAKGQLTAVLMHSITEAYLAKRELIKYVQEAGQSTRIATYMNKRVIVDDAMPYDTETKVGSIYLFGAGAIALGNGSHPSIQQTELVRDSMSHPGIDTIVSRHIHMMHPRGIKWTETNVVGEFPTREELADGANWERVFEPKQIRIVKHTFRIGESEPDTSGTGGNGGD